jgi:hypothetical protein
VQSAKSILLYVTVKVNGFNFETAGVFAATGALNP